MAKKPNDLDPPKPQPRRRLPGLRWIKQHRAAALILASGFLLVTLAVGISLGRSSQWNDWINQVDFFSPRSPGGSAGSGEPGTMTFRPDGTAELGEYSVKIFNPASGATLRTDFRLEGRTACKDKDAFDEFMQGNHRFFREQVMVTLRDCEPGDLSDPDLQLLEKKLVSRVNRALGRPFLKSANVKGFALFESSAEESEFAE